MTHSTPLRILLPLAIALPSFLFGQNSFYAVHSPDGSGGVFATVDISTGTETDPLPVMLNGNQVDGCTGMAYDPTSGEVYVVTKQSSTVTLGTIDVTSGVVTAHAELTEKIAAIAFSDDGVLYGMTGDGATTPETLYTIDTTTGSLTLITAPGTGSDGEALAYNSMDGLLYRYGGDILFQSIDPANGTVTDINLVGGTVSNYAHSLAYNNGSFVFAAGNKMYALSVNGTLVETADIVDVGYKGLVRADIASAVAELPIDAPSIFPNPATDRIEITVPTGGIDRLRIHDARGTLVMDERLNNAQRHQLMVNGWAEGLYTVEISSGSSIRTGTFTVVR